MNSIPITIDFETFYSSAFTLSTMTTAEYVLSEWFEIIGVAVKVGNDPAEWFSGTHDEIWTWLKQFPFEEPGYTTVIQNSHFDGSILEWVLDIHPSRYFCTRMAARATVLPYTKKASLKVIAEYLGVGHKGSEVEDFKGFRRADFTPAQLARYGEYCKNDVELTHQIAEILGPKIAEDEHDLIHYTTTKFTRPVLHLDEDVITQRLAEVRAEKDAVLVRAGLDTPEALMSNDKFANALRLLGVEPPTKISPLTGKITYAFAKNDAEFKDLLDHEDSRVQALVAARLKHKSTQEETRLVKFQKQVWLGRPFAVPILYYGAHTGRFSGLDGLNLQNLPRGGALRKSLIAPPGYVVMAGDLSQIEARATAYFAKESKLLARWDAGDDVYKWFASSALYNKPEDQIAKEERFVAKTCILGMGYGVGAKKFHTVMKAAGIDMTEAEAKRTVNTYRNTFASIPRLWEHLDIAMQYMIDNKRYSISPIPVVFGNKFIGLPNGMRLVYPEMHNARVAGEFKERVTYMSHRGERSLWGGALLENIVQAVTRIVLTDAELFLARKGYPAALSVHDELVYVVREDLAEKFATVLERVLTRPVPFLPGLPIAAEVHYGPSYLECK